MYTFKYFSLRFQRVFLSIIPCKVQGLGLPVLVVTWPVQKETRFSHAGMNSNYVKTFTGTHHFLSALRTHFQGFQGKDLQGIPGPVYTLNQSEKRNNKKMTPTTITITVILVLPIATWQI